MNWLCYLLEANLYLILFYALYYLVLRRETWHQYNRAYLLGSSLLAFIIPVLQLGFLKSNPVTDLPVHTVVRYSYATPAKVAVAPDPTWTRDDTFLAIYLAIVLILLIGLVIKVVRILLLSRKGIARDFGKWKFVNAEIESGAFSFFNYLFVSADMASSDMVIKHELVHIHQKHSWDIIYLEIFRIINWFNPVAYLLQRSMKELHEFIADEANNGSNEQINAYTDFLVANAYGTYEQQLTNNLFNQSLLKKRIMMLHQKRSGSSARLKYLLALPLLGGLLCASTLAFAKDYGWIDIAPASHTNGVISDKKIGAIGYIVDPKFYNFEKLTDLTLKFHKLGYKMDFDQYKENGSPVLKISLKKLNSSPEHAATATFRIDELKKIDYVIFVGFDKNNNILYVHSDKRDLSGQKKMDTLNNKVRKGTDSIIRGKTSTTINKKLDSIIRNNKGKNINKQIDSVIKDHNDKIDSKIKSQIDQRSANKLQASQPVQPIEQPTDTTMQAFYRQIAKNVRYPAAARDSKIAGRVFAVFSIDENNNIVNVGVLRSPDKVMSQEVVRVLKMSSGKFKGQTGVTYTLPVFFTIQVGQTGSEAPTTAPMPDAVIQRDQPVKTNKNIYLSEVVVTSYIMQ